MNVPAHPDMPVFSAVSGEMAERVRAFDWSATPLGPIYSWPQSLKTAAGMVLQSPVPIVMLWGEDGIMIYNDAYSVFAGRRHPHLLGSKVREGWPEVADFNDNVMKVGLAGGTLAYRDQELTLYRNGVAEQVWMNLDYSPIPDESGMPAGVMAIVAETSQRVLSDAALKASEARKALLLDLLQGQRETGNPDAMMRAAAEAIGRHLRVHRAGFFEMHDGDRMAFGPSWTDGTLSRLEGALPAAIIGTQYLAQVRRGQTLGIADTASDPLTADSKFDDIGARSIIGAPILRNGRWQAGLYVNHGVVRAWTAEEVALVRDVAGQTWDAVERARAVTALRDNEARLRLATEAAEVGFWDVDVVTDTLYWPGRVKAMFGISPDVPVSMADFFAGLHPDDRAATSAAYAAATDPGTRVLYDVEYRTVGKEDGVIRWVAAKGRGLFDDHGTCVRVIGTAIDVTARKRIEARLHELNETLERRVEERTAERDRVWRNSRDLLVVIDADGLIRAANPAWTEILGRKPEEVVGHSYSDFILPEDAQLVAAALSDALSSRDLTGFEVQVLHSDGTARWISWHTSLEAGLVYGYGRDVTAVKAQERALMDAETALRQAQKMEAVGQLTGGIAHDFNNLLQGVAGSLDLIRRKSTDTERVRLWAEAGLQTAERAAKLTSQLLAFSRSQKLELKPLDISALLSGMRELLDRTLGPAVRVSLDLDVSASGIMGDQTQLEMAVLNLAINARDAMPRGGELRISTRRCRVDDDPELSPGDYIELAVTDTGAGMSPDVQGRAFDPFFTTKGVGKGTGLGLSQVYGMTRQAGGIARIGSSTAQGTTITLMLRRTTEDAEPEEPGQDGELRGRLARAVALVVDDDPAVRQFLADSLDMLGYSVEQAQDGYAALASLARSSFDVMVIDYAMPGLTGAEVAVEARAARPDLPIVFASGYADTAAIENVQDANTSILRKPFRIGDLQDAVAKVLRR